MAEGAPIAAVVVNFNAGELLVRSASALLAAPEVSRLEVFDNASTDDSLDQLSRKHADTPKLHVTRNEENIGFASAVNRCAQRVDEEHLLVVNPDCVLEPGAVGTLLGAISEDPGAALAGPCVIGEKGDPERSNLRQLPRPWTSFMSLSGLWRLSGSFPMMRGIAVDTHHVVQAVRAEAVSGACMLIRRDVLAQVGDFDEHYGLHCEDLDLMARLAEAGWHCLYVPSAIAHHWQGTSSRSRPLWVHWQKHRGMARYFRKFQAGRHAWPVRAMVQVGIWSAFLLRLPWVWIR